MKNIFKAVEAVDKTIYLKFIREHSNKNYKIEAPESLYCPYDVVQKLDGEITLIELKTRFKYDYDSFDDISIDLSKIENLKKEFEKEKAKYLYVCAIYPSSDKIVLIDITNIKYDEKDIVTRKANKHTLNCDGKKDKEFIQLNIKKDDDALNTKTYIYSFENLKETYINLFQKYCKKYNIENAVLPYF